MNKKIKKRWTKALRSGDYDQGAGMLCSIKKDEKGNIEKASYCCLGVLVEIHRGEGSWVEVNENALAPRAKCYDICFPSKNLLKEVGLKVEDAEELADMNDCGSTFDEIADWIKENL